MFLIHQKRARKKDDKECFEHVNYFTEYVYPNTDNRRCSDLNSVSEQASHNCLTLLTLLARFKLNPFT